MKNGTLVLDGINETAVITLEEYERLLEDAARLDFLQQQGGGRKWVSRPSGTGRGYRTYTGSTRPLTYESVREAIDADRERVEQGFHIPERQFY